MRPDLSSLMRSYALFLGPVDGLVEQTHDHGVGGGGRVVERYIIETWRHFLLFDGRR